MEKSISDKYRDVLPGDLTRTDIDNACKFFDSIDLKDLENWTTDRTATYRYHDQDFQMIVDTPKDGNPEKAVLVLSEFATGIVPRLMVKSQIIRDMVDPEATLVIQPSSIQCQQNMNYSYKERLTLRSGNLAPIIGRIAITMCSLGSPKDLTIFGSSQGATVGLDYASKMESPAHLAVVEIPNITERSTLNLTKDYMCSGKDLRQAVEANFDNHKSPFAVFAKNSTLFLNQIKYSYGFIHPDNMSMLETMRYASAFPHIKSILNNGGSVVHAWGNVDKVSPEDKNQLIAKTFENNPRYSSRLLRGMGHTAGDLYALDGALARLAHNK